MTERTLASIKEQVLTSGAPSLSDTELVAALLAYAKHPTPFASAQHLLSIFGSLSRLFRANENELLSLGLSPHAATLFTLVLPLWGRALAEELPRHAHLATASQTGEYLSRLFFGAKAESAYLLLLDKDYSLLDCRRVANGSINTATLNTRVVAETAVFGGASYVILAHNHPAGSVMPSRNDLGATERLAYTFETIGIPLLEHFIIAEGEHLPILWATNAMHPKCPAGYYDREYAHITLETL